MRPSRKWNVSTLFNIINNQAQGLSKCEAPQVQKLLTHEAGYDGEESEQ